MCDNKNKIVSYVLCGSLFVILFIYLSIIHPIYILDMDDWNYISYRRIAMPVWGAWNPVKVFPEVVLPFCASIGRYIFYPVIHDYPKSIMLACALFASLLLTVYFYMFYRLCVDRYEARTYIAALITIVFMECHFYIFCNSLTDNGSLFYSPAHRS